MTNAYANMIRKNDMQYTVLTADVPKERVEGVYRVRENGNLIGYMRHVVKPYRWQYAVKFNDGEAPRWIDSTPLPARKRNALEQLSKAAKGTPYTPTPKQETPKQDGDGRELVRCSCGHMFPYRIDNDTTREFVSKRPCPPCKARGIKPEDGPQEQETPKQPEPKPVPEIDAQRVEEILSTFPTVPELPHHAVLPDLLLLLDAKQNVWLQGPPGTSKSTLVEQAANVLGRNFYSVQCHEMMTESTLLGYRDANGTYHSTQLREAFENGGVLLLDEVDNGNPNLLAVMNSAIANGFCVFAGEMVRKHDEFLLVAAANTAGLGPEAGFIGRNGVDLATRDRFVTLQVPIDERLELALAHMVMGESDALAKVVAKSVKASQAALRKRAENASAMPDADAVTEAVRKVRKQVDKQFRGVVVGPRAVMHAAAMVTRGFTLREAITAKLPGLKTDEIELVLREV